MNRAECCQRRSLDRHLASDKQIRQALTTIEPSAAVQVRTLASASEDLACRFSVLVTFVSFLGIAGVVLALIGVYVSWRSSRWRPSAGLWAFRILLRRRIDGRPQERMPALTLSRVL